MKRVAVVGSRGFSDLDEVRFVVWSLERDTVVISGGAHGVDHAAIEEARRLRMVYEVYPADWNRHGKSAGAIRNRTIVEKADEIVAFWDGKSKGTALTIEIAKRHGKPCRVVRDAW